MEDRRDKLGGVHRAELEKQGAVRRTVGDP